MSLSTSPILAAAASNDLKTVRWLVERESVPVDCSADWLVPDSSGVNNGVKSGADGRGVNGDGAGRKQLERTRRTPLMVAASHGGLEVLSYLLRAGADPNARSEDAERCTAMHCAASGGSAMSAEAIRLLLLFGADRTAADAYGRLPVDVLPGGGVGQNGSLGGAVGRSSFLGVGQNGGEAGPGSGSGSRGGNSSSGGSSEGTSPPNEYNGRGGNHSSDDSLGHDDNGLNERGMMNGTTMNGPTMNGPKQSNAGHSSGNLSNEPDAETRLSDDFRMYEFKVRRCSRTRAHDWTECPFTHPGEKARRRDPRRFNYCGTACPEFRKGSCPRGDACEFAHGVFECWLHPSRYRTQLCKDGLQCARRACFFAHASHQLRPPTDAFGNVLAGMAGGGNNRGVVEGMSGGHGGASYCQTVPVPGVHVSSGGGLGYSGHGSGNGSGNGSGSGSGNGSSGGSGGSNSPGGSPRDGVGGVGGGGRSARGSDDGNGNTGSSGNTGNTGSGGGDGGAREPPNFHSSSQFSAASAAAALLRGGVDGPTGLQRRSFDSAFGDSMSLLAGMSSLGLDQTARQPRISEGSTMGAGAPRNSTGSNFWMGGAAGAGGGIAFGAGAQTANNAAALQMLLNGHGASIPPGMVNPLNGVNGVNGYAVHAHPRQYSPSPPQTPMSPGLTPTAAAAAAAGFNAFGNGGRDGSGGSSGTFEPPNAVAPAPPPPAKPQWVPTVDHNGDVHLNGAGIKGPNAPGSPGPPRVSSFQHLGMIEGVLGDDQFYGA